MPATPPSHVDPLTSKYRGYAKINATVTGQRRRAIGYSEGTGFESWPPMRLIMARMIWMIAG